MTTARVLAVAALAVLLAGCGEPSPVDPQARVQVSGSVKRAEGQALSQGRAVVMKEIGPDELAADAPAFFGTMGLVCLTRMDLDVCDEQGTAADLEGDGTFSVELRGSDVQSGFGTVSTLWASVEAPSADDLPGPAVSHAFRATAETVELPAMTLWEPPVTLQQRGGQVRAQWPTVPRSLGRRAVYTGAFATDEGETVWSVRRAGADVDTRVLEDFNGTFTVEARVEADDSPLDGPVVYRSGAQSFTGPGAAPSRGAGCSAVASGRETVVYDPCPLTDGDVGEVFSPALDPRCPEGRECPHWDTKVVLDLGERRDLRLLVIRAEPDTWVLDVSDDARSWRRLRRVELRRPHATVQVPAKTRARYLRLRAARWPLRDLTEVSVW